MQDYTKTVLALFRTEKYSEALGLSREFISKYEYYLPAHILAAKAAYALKDNALAERIIDEMPLGLMSKKNKEELLTHLRSNIIYGKYNNYESIIEKAKLLTTEKSQRYEELYYSEAEPELEEEESQESYPINEQMAQILIFQGLNEQAREILSKLILLNPEKEEYYKGIIDSIN